MKTEWTEELCSSEPPIFQQLNPTTYIQRKNIVRLPMSEDGVDNGYKCESRKISIDVYQELQDQTVLIEQVVARSSVIDAAYRDGYNAAMILLGGEE